MSTFWRTHATCYSASRHEHTPPPQSSLCAHATHTHTHTHTQTHTHTRLPLKTHTSTDKKEIECKRTWPEALLLSPDTETLYLCLSDGVSCLPLSFSVYDCHLRQASPQENTAGLLLSSPYHFTFRFPFSVSLSLSRLPRWYSAPNVRKVKSEHLSGCSIRGLQKAVFPRRDSKTLSIMLHQCVVCLLQRDANLIQQSQRPCNYLLGYSFIDVRFVLGVCALVCVSVCEFTFFFSSCS